MCDSAGLVAAITNANTNGGGTITLGSNITLTSELPSIATNVTVDGGNFALSGNNQYRGLVIAGFSINGPVPITVNIQNLTIQNTVATGGTGGTGSAAGGGGAGLGGALFIANLATVTVSNVQLVSNTAVGGAGGVANGAVAGGGGGGMGGAGGAGGVVVFGNSGGGGGGFGTTATGGITGVGGGPGTLSLAASGGSVGGTSGGANGGGGAGSCTDCTDSGAGGGAGGTSPSFLFPGGGNGGFGGGGGGSSTSIGFYVFTGGRGGYGGGGGGAGPAGGNAPGGQPGGVGGFSGGGGGSTDGSTALSSFAGGSNNGTTSGGGGGGLGGAVFVQTGGLLQVGGAFTVNGNSVAGGAGGTGAASGTGVGSGLFLDGFGTLAVSTGSNVTIADSIADLGGSSNGGSWGVYKDGTGTLVLSGTNSYSGGTTINAGTVSISADANLGTGSVTFHTGGTLAVTGSGAYNHDTTINGTGTFNVSPGVTAGWNGAVGNAFLSADVGPPIIIPGAVSVTGGGTLVLGNATNSYSGGTIVTGGSTVSIASDGALGSSGGSLTLGDATTSGALAITTNGAFSSSRPLFLGAGGGIIDTSAATSATWGGTISGAGGLTKNGDGTLTLAGANTYAGPTTIHAGTLLAGSSTAFGSSGIFSIAAVGTLDFNGFGQTVNSLTGSGTLALSGGATMNIGANNADTTFGGSIAGSGGIVKGGTGTLTLTGPSTFSGGTTVFGGTLAASAGALGTGAVALANGTTFSPLGAGTFSNNLQLAVQPSISITTGNTVTWNGAVSDFGSSGAVQLSGGGTLVLGNAANSYSGGTAVTGGSTLQIASDGALGAAGTTLALGDATTAGTLVTTGSFTSSRSLVFGAGGATIDTLGGSSATFTGSATGAGGLTKTGSGTLTLDAANYGGPTNILAGTLRTGGANLFGANGSLSVATGATIDLNGFSQSLNSLSGGGNLVLGGAAQLTLGSNGSSITFGGSLTGNGSLVKNGGGVLTLTGANTYSGGTTVNGGALLGNASSLQGNILNNASVVFDQAGTGTYGGSMSGTGSLTKNGNGTLTLTGTNTYTGGTFLNTGTLVGSTTSLQGTIVNNAALVFDQQSLGTFNGTLFGNGTVTKTGLGALAINGVNPFGGNLSIGEGALLLNGSVAGNVAIASGASLRGAGVIGGSLNLAGTLFVPAPGTTAASFNAARLGLKPQDAANAPSIIINGNLTATPGSVLDFTVTPKGATPIVVNGLANLNGSHINATVLDPNPARYATYIGLTSGGLTINNVDAFSPTPGIVPVFKYDPRAIAITLLNENIPLGGEVTTPNSVGAGGAIDRLKPNMSGDLAFVVRELTALDPTSLDNALRQIAGEVHATELRMTFDDAARMTDLAKSALGDRDDDPSSGGRRSTGSSSIRWWFETVADHGHYSPNGFDAATSNAGGGGGGLDFRPASALTLGGGGAFSLADMSMSGLGGSSNMKAPRAFGYTGYTAGPFGFSLGGSASRTVYATQRPIAFQAIVPSPDGTQPLSGGVDRTADADQVGVIKDTWTEIKDTLKRGTWVGSWKIGWRRTQFDRNPFVETGADALSLIGLAQSLNTKEANLDINVYRKRGTWRPRILVTYKRQLGELATTAPVQLGDSPAGQFVTNGVPIPLEEFHGIFGLTWRSSLGLEYTFEYETLRAKDENHDGVHFRVRFK